MDWGLQIGSPELYVCYDVTAKLGSTVVNDDVVFVVVNF